MTDMGLGVVGWAAAACLVLVIVGMALAFIRMVLGPSLPDRVVGLDMLTVLMVAFAAAFSIAVDETAFLDVAIVLALVGFLGTVAFARYAERRTSNEHPPEMMRENENRKHGR
jgi:multicomponent Na+:H+ antiporter subunit F